MASILILDKRRPVLTEHAFGESRLAKSIRPGTQKYLVFQWPGTGTWTLAPINLNTEFVQTRTWDFLKFRLSDVVCNTDWWEEIPDTQVYPDNLDPGDYFFKSSVKSENVPQTPAQSGGYQKPILENLSHVFGERQLQTGVLNLGNSELVNVMYSNEEFPINQGYHLRFFVEGRPTYRRNSLLDFYFGEFVLRLGSDGLAEVQQSNDFAVYKPVYTWQWALSGEVHQRYHEITIFPHARNKIEFLAGTSRQGFGHAERLFFIEAPPRARGMSAGGLYELPPADLQVNTEGLPIITQASRWYLSISREFLADIQISRLGFYNGDDLVAGLYDTPIVLEQPPTVEVFLGADADAPTGTTFGYGLWDFVAKAPFVSDGMMHQPMFFCTLHGKGDLSESGNPRARKGSSVTPELYSYSFYKPALFAASPRTEVTTDIKSAHLELGRQPEEERATFFTDNSDGPLGGYGSLDAFTRRAHIPLQLLDSPSGLVYFEGTCDELEASEAPAQEPRTLAFHCRGMADQLLRARWGPHPPDFGNDPVAPGEGWWWPDVVRACFEQGGFNPFTQVLIEEEDDYTFRLWQEGESGGQQRTGGADKGAGHMATSAFPGLHWMPMPGSPVYQFLDFLLGDILGWAWYWSKQEGGWRVYKRPNPMNALDWQRGKFVPRAEFYGSTLGPQTAFPSTSHRNLRFRTTRPRCSALNVQTSLYESGYITRQDLNDSLASYNPASDPTDPVIAVNQKRLVVSYANPNCYGPLATDVTHPDYLGEYTPADAYALQIVSRGAAQYVGRHLYFDNCFGQVWAEWDGAWGGYISTELRKYDAVLLDSGRDPVTGHPNFGLELWLLDSIEPYWEGGGSDNNRRARYRATRGRLDCPPPR